MQSFEFYKSSPVITTELRDVIM